MKTAGEILEDVAGKIEAGGVVDSGTYEIVIDKKELIFRKMLIRNDERIQVMRLSAKSVNDGPTPKEWDDAYMRVLDLRMRGLI